MSPLIIVLVGVAFIISLVASITLIVRDLRKKKNRVNIESIIESAMIDDDYMNDPITDKQRKYLLHLGCKKKDMPLTKYEASAMIDKYLDE